LVNLVSIETITQESTGLALCERQLKNFINKQKINNYDIRYNYYCIF